MPSLKVFGKQWNVSSDDVPIPGTFLLVFHITVRPPAQPLSRLSSLHCVTASETHNYTPGLLAARAVPASAPQALPPPPERIAGTAARRRTCHANLHACL